MLATALTRSLSRCRLEVHFALALALCLALAGCGTGDYEEKLNAAVQAMRAGQPPDQTGDAAQPAAPAGEQPADPVVDEAQKAAAAEAANASGQGVVGRAILAPTDAFP